MSLSAHVSGKSERKGDKNYGHLARYAERNQEIPKHEMPQSSMAASAAADFIRSELRLDGNPNLNLASFVTTQVDREAVELITESLNKNMPDQDQSHILPSPHPNHTLPRLSLLLHCSRSLPPLPLRPPGILTATISRTAASTSSRSCGMRPRPPHRTPSAPPPSGLARPSSSPASP